MTIEFVNEAHTYGGGNSGTIASAAQNHTAGNLLVVFVGHGETSSKPVSGIADTAGNSYTYIRTKTATGMLLEVWYAKNILGNANNIVTATFGNAVTYREISVLQYTGLNIIGPLDVSSDGSGGSGYSWSTDAVQTNNDHEVIVAGYFKGGGCVLTAGSNFNLRYDGTDLGTEDRIVSSMGSYGSAITSDTSRSYIALHATLTSDVTVVAGLQSSSGSVLNESINSDQVLSMGLMSSSGTILGESINTDQVLTTNLISNSGLPLSITIISNNNITVNLITANSSIEIVSLNTDVNISMGLISALALILASSLNLDQILDLALLSIAGSPLGISLETDQILLTTIIGGQSIVFSIDIARIDQVLTMELLETIGTILQTSLRTDQIFSLSLILSHAFANSATWWKLSAYDFLYPQMKLSPPPQLPEGSFKYEILKLKG